MCLPGCVADWVFLHIPYGPSVAYAPPDMETSPGLGSSDSVATGLGQGGSSQPVGAGDLDSEQLTDEEAARHARERYREHGLPTLEADAVVGPHLQADERVLGYRADAALARVDDATTTAPREFGPLYVTSTRLLHLGRQATSVALAEMGELVMADDRMLITLGSVRGLMLDVAQPRQLRVLLAAAKAALGR